MIIIFYFFAYWFYLDASVTFLLEKKKWKSILKIEIYTKNETVDSNPSSGIAYMRSINNNKIT